MEQQQCNETARRNCGIHLDSREVETEAVAAFSDRRRIQSSVPTASDRRHGEAPPAGCPVVTAANKRVAK